MDGALRPFLATCGKKSKTDRKLAWRTGPTPPFLRLPGKLRLKIYEYLLSSGTVWSYGLYDNKRCNSLAILFTSRQIYQEAVDVLYSQMAFTFGIYKYPGMFDFAKFPPIGIWGLQISDGLSRRLVQELLEPDQVADRLAEVRKAQCRS